MVDKAMADLSDQLMLVTVLLYLVAMLGYAADLAFGGRREVVAAAAAGDRADRHADDDPADDTADTEAGDRVPALVAGGTAGSDVARAAESDTARVTGSDTGARGPDTTDTGDTPDAIDGTGETGSGVSMHWGRFAVLITVFGWAAHLAEIVTRGLSAHRVPWGNMYEFAAAIVFAAVTTYLVVLTRQPVRYLGVFVTLLSVLGLGIAAIWLYTDAGPLVPALRSYWIAIHVTLAIAATGLLTLAAVTTVLYLVAGRHRVGWLPERSGLDRIAHQTIMFAFPIWTLAVMAGAVWADEAWGRYWGWDPKETWSFITWVMYAGYLHARATAGWRGNRAAVVALVAYGTLLFNFFGVNFLISGLHSYAG